MQINYFILKRKLYNHIMTRISQESDKEQSINIPIREGSEITAQPVDFTIRLHRMRLNRAQRTVPPPARFKSLQEDSALNQLAPPQRNLRLIN